MFEDSLVVSSALSAFNNAALIAPAFFWNAVLALPLFVAIYMIGRSFFVKWGLVQYVNSARVSFWIGILTAMWVVFMGGNYEVLRDGVSLLPWVTAAILFVVSVLVGGKTRGIALPLWFGSANATRRRRWFVNILGLCVILVAVGFSGTLNWLAALLQVCAVLIGLACGRYTKWQVRLVPCIICVMLMATTALLMQPEYFRFGQLGNLTPIHLIWVLGTGICSAAALVMGITKPKGRIHQSAYVKLKWLLRIMTCLSVVLFLLTESVPLFLAAVLCAMLMFAMSVWHRTAIPENAVEKLLGWTGIMFGVLIGVPTITAMGVLMIALFGSGKKTDSFGFLL